MLCSASESPKAKDWLATLLLTLLLSGATLEYKQLMANLSIMWMGTVTMQLHSQQPSRTHRLQLVRGRQAPIETIKHCDQDFNDFQYCAVSLDASSCKRCAQVSSKCAGSLCDMGSSLKSHAHVAPPEYVLQINTQQCKHDTTLSRQCLSVGACGVLPRA